MRSRVRVATAPFLFLAVVPVPFQRVEPPPVRVVVGEVALALPPGQRPFLEDGITMVPAKPLLQALGADVRGDGRSVTALRACRSVSLENGSTALKVDGTPQPLPVAARKVGGELFAPLRSLAEAMDTAVSWNPSQTTARLMPPRGEEIGGHQARVSITLRQEGTLFPPANLRDARSPVEVGPGTYSWIIEPDRTGRNYTWSFLPASGVQYHSVSVTFTSKSFHTVSRSDEMTVTVEATTLLHQWDVEQAVRRQLGRTSGPLAEQDLQSVESLVLPPRLQSVSELCRFPRLTDLVLEHGAAYAPDFLAAAVARAPGLRRLTLTGSADLPAPPSADTVDTARFPLRVETPHGIFRGDRGMTMATLLPYASEFESTVITELERDTGLRPSSRKVVFHVYGDKPHWDSVTANSQVWGYYSAQEQRIHMAHWKTPGSVNALLLAHELFHWLAWEEGKVNLPTWLNEGLAHNLSWRIEQGAGSWLNAFVRREWLRVAGNPGVPVPALPEHSDQDEFTITAVALLLQTRDRNALVRFFALTREGTAFAAAFETVFGSSTAAFEREYNRYVRELRAGR
ncbi:MAG TPA: copper amine oxidase N-terminal domain-containing protein [Symbiobacteriaceae bacterium]|nr:copper amine oxidase N-terminal domain-containing protein [Symbiobacteriaceae bacterium]